MILYFIKDNISQDIIYVGVATEESLSKIKSSLKGRTNSESSRKKLSDKRKGTNDHRQKIIMKSVSDLTETKFNSLKECMSYLKDTHPGEYNYSVLRRKSSSGTQYKDYVFT